MSGFGQYYAAVDRSVRQVRYGCSDHGNGNLREVVIMGAEDFMFAVSGTDLKKLHAEAVEQALYDYGHAGYTGSIAEKPQVELRADGKVFPTVGEAEAFAHADQDENDKWGPAFAVAYGANGKVEGYVLYGWASL
jgi:hypothetical protein